MLHEFQILYIAIIKSPYMSLLIKKKKSPYMSLNPILVHKLLIKIKGKKKKPAYADGIREGTRTL